MNSSSPGQSWREPYSYANNAGIGSTTVCSTGSRLLTSNLIPCEAANSTLNLGIFWPDSGEVPSSEIGSGFKLRHYPDSTTF
jgi:hypothetical protein